LDSIAKQTFRDFETILVDNGSKDGSLEFVADKYPWVKILSLATNKGFTGGANQGLQIAQGEYIALINNDIELEADWLMNLWKALEENPFFDFCTGKTFSYSSHHLLDGAGDTFLRAGFFYRIGTGERDMGQYDNFGEVFGVCAGVALYRKTFFEQVGLFDEDFFLYLEDGDLNFRARLRGLRCLRVPGAVAYHRGGATSGSNTDNSLTPPIVRYTTRNQIILLIKDVPSFILWRSLLLILMGQSYWLYKAVFRHKHWKSYFQGFKEAIAQIPITLQKRKEVMQAIRVNPKELYREIKRWEMESLICRLKYRQKGS
jgi:hypothetical protein